MHPRIDDLLGDDDVGLGEDGVGGRGVAGLPVEAMVVGLAVEIGADHRCRRVQRLADIDDRSQRLIVNVDELQGISRGVAILGDDECDLLALEPHLVGGQHGLHVIGQGGHPGQALGGEIGAGDDGLDLRMGLGGADVDAVDRGVGVGRAQDRQVQHAGQLHVIDIVAAATNKARILLAQHPAVAAGLLVVVGGVVLRDRTLYGGHACASSLFGCFAAH